MTNGVLWLATGYSISRGLKLKQGKPRWPLEEPSQRSFGTADRSWNPWRAACGSRARWISGNDGSHEEQQDAERAAGRLTTRSTSGNDGSHVKRQDAGRAACRPRARWISGNDGSHEERLYQTSNNEVSWLHRWQERSYELPLSIFEQLALCAPSSKSKRFTCLRQKSDNGEITLQTDLYVAGLKLIGLELKDLIGLF